MTQALFVTIARFVWPDFTSQTLSLWTPLRFQSLSASPSCFRVVEELSCLLALAALGCIGCAALFWLFSQSYSANPHALWQRFVLEIRPCLDANMYFFRLGWSILRDDPSGNSGSPAPDTDTDKRVSLFKANTSCQFDEWFTLWRCNKTIWEVAPTAKV